KGRNEKYTLIFGKKISTPIEELTKGFPQEFATYLNYCRSLKFHEMPDYKYLRSIFRELSFNLGYTYDCKWDWVEGPHSIINNIILKNQRYGDPYSNSKRRDDKIQIKYNFI